jgi:hypothetical protein
MRQPYKDIGWPTIIGLLLVVVAFMVLSLFVTATGTSRFAVAMGYDARIGYVVGVVFEVAKEVLPVVLLALLCQRAIGTALMLGTAWICLVAFSCLATHATVSSAISSIERTGTWRMEVRGNTKAELSSIDQQLAALSRPTPPRPAKTVQEALKAERVPPGVWQDSQECANIQDRAHFMKACAQVVQLRKELAAARDYERLSLRATELRQGVAEAPIIATADPLPAAFSATLGRLLPVGGTEGVALLLTIVVELISCVGLGGVAVLCSTRKQREGAPAIASLPGTGSDLRETGREPPCRPSAPALSKPSLGGRQPSLGGLASGAGRSPRPGKSDAREASSNILPMRPRVPSDGLPGEGTSAQTSPLSSHVPDFVRQCLKRATGSSLGATELRGVYEVWCEMRGYDQLTVPKFAAELKRLGVDKWKSSGLIRYRDLELVAYPQVAHGS